MISSYATMAENNTDTLKTNLKFDLGFEGMLGASVGNNFFAFNVGGPSLRFRITRDLKIGVGALPSFYFKNGKPGGKLGVSPRIDFKNWALITPFYHFENSDKWVFTIGIGFKFTDKAKQKV